VTRRVLNLVTYLCPRNYLASGRRPEIIVGGDREPAELSANDTNVIKALLEKPRARLVELAGTTGLNPRTIKNKIQDLQERRVIMGFKSTFDTTTLGISKSRLLLKLHNITAEREEELLTFLRFMKNTTQINKTIGDWDLEIDLETMETGQTRRIILKIKEKFQELIERFNLIQFDQYYKRSYLPKYLFQD